MKRLQMLFLIPLRWVFFLRAVVTHIGVGIACAHCAVPELALYAQHNGKIES